MSHRPLFACRAASVRFAVPVRSVAILCLLAGLAGALASCAPSWRDATYGPSFAYLERTQIRDAMHRLALGVHRLDGVLREADQDGGPASGSPSQEAVLAALDDMYGAARSMRGGKVRTNHPLLDQHLDRFLFDVQRAREGARADPPNYFFAGQLTGSCLACHGPR